MHSDCTILDALVWHDGADTILIREGQCILEYVSKKI